MITAGAGPWPASGRKTAAEVGTAATATMWAGMIRSRAAPILGALIAAGMTAYASSRDAHRPAAAATPGPLSRSAGGRLSPGMGRDRPRPRFDDGRGSRILCIAGDLSRNFRGDLALRAGGRPGRDRAPPRRPHRRAPGRGAQIDLRPGHALVRTAPKSPASSGSALGQPGAVDLERDQRHRRSWGVPGTLTIAFEDEDRRGIVHFYL